MGLSYVFFVFKIKLKMFNIIYFDSIHSSNDYIWENIDDLPNGSVIVAAQQTDGKGRNGKVWSSPLGNL